MGFQPPCLHYPRIPPLVGRIHERTITLRFLGILLRVLRLEFCMDFLNHREGDVVLYIRFSSFLLYRNCNRLREFEETEISSKAVEETVNNKEKNSEDFCQDFVQEFSLSVRFINEDKRTGHNDNSLDSSQYTTKKTLRKITQNCARFYNCHVNRINVLQKKYDIAHTFDTF